MGGKLAKVNKSIQSIKLFPSNWVIWPMTADAMTSSLTETQDPMRMHIHPLSLKCCVYQFRVSFQLFIYLYNIHKQLIIPWNYFHCRFFGLYRRKLGYSPWLLGYNPWLHGVQGKMASAWQPIETISPEKLNHDKIQFHVDFFLTYNLWPYAIIYHAGTTSHTQRYTHKFEVCLARLVSTVSVLVTVFVNITHTLRFIIPHKCTVSPPNFLLLNLGYPPLMPRHSFFSQFINR